MTVMARPMGRPPLSQGEETKTTAVRMPMAVFERIVAVAGKGRMAEFIRAAIEEKLQAAEGAKPPRETTTKNKPRP